MVLQVFFLDDIFKVVELADGPWVCSKPLLEEWASNLCLSELDDIHSTAFVRSETNELVDNLADKFVVFSGWACCLCGCFFCWRHFVVLRKGRAKPLFSECIVVAIFRWHFIKKVIVLSSIQNDFSGFLFEIDLKSRTMSDKLNTYFVYLGIKKSSLKR